MVKNHGYHPQESVNLIKNHVYHHQESGNFINKNRHQISGNLIKNHGSHHQENQQKVRKVEILSSSGKSSVIIIRKVCQGMVASVGEQLFTMMDLAKDHNVSHSQIKRLQCESVTNQETGCFFNWYPPQKSTTKVNLGYVRCI